MCCSGHSVCLQYFILVYSQLLALWELTFARYEFKSQGFKMNQLGNDRLYTYIGEGVDSIKCLQA